MTRDNAECIATAAMQTAVAVGAAYGAKPGMAIFVFVVLPGDEPGQVHVTHAQGLAQGADEAAALGVVRDWIENRHPAKTE